MKCLEAAEIGSSTRLAGGGGCPVCPGTGCAAPRLLWGAAARAPRAARAWPRLAGAEAIPAGTAGSRRCCPGRPGAFGCAWKRRPACCACGVSGKRHNAHFRLTSN